MTIQNQISEGGNSHPTRHIIPKTYYRLSDILQMLPISRSTFYRRQNDGLFPRGTKFGGVVIFSPDDIEQILDAIDSRRTVH